MKARPWLGRLTPQEAARIQDEVTRAGFHVQWTVTTGTSDLGRLFGARAHFIGREGGKSVHHVSASLLVAESLDDLRRMLPPGLIRLDRQPGDERVIVEVWM